jgi:hypothetical protein
MNDQQTYLAFVWTPAGYELREEHGQLPQLGETIESDDGKRRMVVKIAPSPLPSDTRVCAYLQG